MDGFSVQGLSPECVEWEPEHWFKHFDGTAESGSPMSCYIFDFATTPKTRGDAAGWVDREARISVMADVPCVDCNRPTTVLFRRWNKESADERVEIIEARMREIGWHELHPARKKRPV
jgi:hypothetical protein